MIKELENIRFLIKAQLKEQNKTYRQLAQDIKISEPSVKRLLTSGDISISRLAQMANAVGKDLFQLVHEAKSLSRGDTTYSKEQEKILSTNPLAAYIFVQLTIRASAHEIFKQLKCSWKIFYDSLLMLDKVNLIEFWDEKNIKMIVKGPFRWNPSGLLEKTYYKRFVETVLNQAAKYSSQTQSDSTNGRTSGFTQVFEFYAHPRTQKDMEDEMKHLIKKYRGKAQVDREIHDTKDLIPISGVGSVYQQDTWFKVLVDS